ncbi:lipopolysaccharide kinase InaA family protein [Endozoicomonas sp.]|nr:lipopolysaccharide kinase InaA family protein [Endozoicomonas sp.]
MESSDKIIDPNWIVTKHWQGTEIEQAFQSLDAVFHLKGKIITQDALSEVILVKLSNTRFYVKRYTQAGKNLRKYLGSSRIRSEWENMLFFHRLGISAANVVGYGEERKCGLFKRGALITEELKATIDLAKLAHPASQQLKDRRWMRRVIQQVADIAHELHSHRFIHTDLKWRNILVTKDFPPKVSLIDCPAGYQWPKSSLFNGIVNRGILKDIACLDKIAKYQLSRSQRLYFYKRYQGINKLRPHDKQQIKTILKFFEGRE